MMTLNILAALTPSDDFAAVCDLLSVALECGEELIDECAIAAVLGMTPEAVTDCMRALTLFGIVEPV